MIVYFQRKSMIWLLWKIWSLRQNLLQIWLNYSVYCSRIYSLWLTERVKLDISVLILSIIFNTNLRLYKRIPDLNTLQHIRKWTYRVIQLNKGNWAHPENSRRKKKIRYSKSILKSKNHTMGTLLVPMIIKNNYL